MFIVIDICQGAEWDFNSGLSWDLLAYEPHHTLNNYVRALNSLYTSEPALYELDFGKAGFEWIDFSDADTSIVSFVRHAKAQDDLLVVVCNFTPVPRSQYRIGVPISAFYREVLNSDSELYGGSNMGNLGGTHSEQTVWHGRDHSIIITVPPLSCMVFKPELAGSR
jgi:1,4-alpha-glucan branching enzyme